MVMVLVNIFLLIKAYCIFITITDRRYSKRILDPMILGGPLDFIFSASDRKIGVFKHTRNLIYLLGEKGETMKGFPLKGASMFSIGKLSDQSGWHLIVGGTDSFLYNYKIETDDK